MESKSKAEQTKDEFAKELGNFLSQDLTKVASQFTDILQKSRKHLGPDLQKEVDAGLADLAKIPDLIAKIKV